MHFTTSFAVCVIPFALEFLIIRWLNLCFNLFYSDMFQLFFSMFRFFSVCLLYLIETCLHFLFFSNNNYVRQHNRGFEVLLFVSMLSDVEIGVKVKFVKCQ